MVNKLYVTSRIGFTFGKVNLLDAISSALSLDVLVALDEIGGDLGKEVVRVEDVGPEHLLC